jgi:uncharacterized protein
MDNSFLGTGWAFPPTFRCETETVEMLKGELDILGESGFEGSIFIIISTAFGERVMQPTFGCDLQPFVFEVMNTPNQAMIEKIVHDALILHEPRIIVNKLSSEFDSLNGILNIAVDYQVITTNTRYNYVYPFYINEATNLIQ